MRVILAMQLKMTCCAYRLCIANAGKHFKPPHPRFWNIFWIGRGGWIPWPSLAFSFAPLPLPAFLSFHTCLHFERILDPQRCPLAEVPLVFGGFVGAKEWLISNWRGVPQGSGSAQPGAASQPGTALGATATATQHRLGAAAQDPHHSHNFQPVSHRFSPVSRFHFNGISIKSMANVI
jgi:hypothetical protein